MEDILRFYHDATGSIYDGDLYGLDLDLGLGLDRGRDDRSTGGDENLPDLDAESDIDEEVVNHEDVEEEEESDEEGDLDWTPLPPTFPANPVNVQPCTSVPGPVDPLPWDSPAYNFFARLFPEEMFERMAVETNRYAEQRQAAQGRRDRYWKEVTVADMKVFVAMNILMGIHVLPEYSCYWSTDDRLRVPGIADLMGKTRYEKINQYFHLVDSAHYIPRGEDGHDPLYKVRPVVKQFRTAAKRSYVPGTVLSIDEAMIAYTGRLYFKQYINAKLWGIKVFCLADPSNGYMMDIDVYTGKINTPMPDGVGHHVVMKMAGDYLDRHHQLYFDNFFAGVKLAEDLLRQKTYACSTIRAGRKGWPQQLNTVNTKKMDAGEIRMMSKGPLLATVWNDKRKVSILSTNAPASITTVERRAKGGKTDVRIPSSVLDYNSHMFGVDLADQLRSYYSVGRSGVKWWRYVFWFIIQLSLVNGWNLFRAAKRPLPGNGRHFAQLQFRLDVCTALVAGNVNKGKKKVQLDVASAGLGSSLSSDHQIDRLYGRKAACKWCSKMKNRSKNGKTSETVYGCTICKIHLHKGECFASFHQELGAMQKQ